MKVSLNELASWCDGQFFGRDYLATGVSIDSRKVNAGDLFVAFKGEHVNGETYVASAFVKGAVCALVSKAYDGSENQVIRVDDVQVALQAIAKRYRQGLKTKIVGITGSVGKTTTKDMVASVLSESFQVFKSKGNFNNEIGLPLMILNLNTSHEWAVLEMGMNHAGEIATLVDIAKPTIAIITNIGTAHIEHLGSQDNIFKAKMEIAQGLSDKDTLIVNGQDAYLKTLDNKTYGLIKCGCSDQDLQVGEVTLSLEGTQFKITYKGQEYKACLNLIGHHHVYNALLAIATGIRAGMTLEACLRGLVNVPITPMRFELKRVGDYHFVNDAYNASLDSIVASAKTFVQLPAKRRIFVVGDVLECGDWSTDIHEKIGQALTGLEFNLVVFVGQAMGHAYRVYQGLGVHFEDKRDALQYLKDMIMPHDAILIKASRGLRLETIIQAFEEK